MDQRSAHATDIRQNIDNTNIEHSCLGIEILFTTFVNNLCHVTAGFPFLNSRLWDQGNDVLVYEVIVPNILLANNRRQFVCRPKGRLIFHSLSVLKWTHNINGKGNGREMCENVWTCIDLWTDTKAYDNLSILWFQQLFQTDMYLRKVEKSSGSLYDSTQMKAKVFFLAID